MGHYVHHTPGRLRVRSALLKRNEQKAGALRRHLELVNGVSSIECNVLTGSILIRYDTKQIDSPALLETLRIQGYMGTGMPTRNVRRHDLVEKVAIALLESAIERSLLAIVLKLL